MHDVFHPSSGVEPLAGPTATEPVLTAIASARRSTHPTSMPASEADPDGGAYILDKLAAVGQVFANADGAEARLAAVVEWLEAELRFRHTTVMRWNTAGIELHIAAATPRHSASSPAATYRAGEGIVGRVAQTGRPILLRRLSQTPEFCNRIFGRQPDWMDAAGFVCVPVMQQEQVLGTLCADLPHEAELTLPVAERLLSAVGGFLAPELGRLGERRAVRRPEGPEHAILGHSRAAHYLRRRAAAMAGNQHPLIVGGEPGTGKHLLAEVLHNGASQDDERPWLSVSALATTKTAGWPGLQQALLGDDDNLGLFEAATGGTLVIEDAEALSPEACQGLRESFASVSARRGRQRSAAPRLILLAQTPVDAGAAAATLRRLAEATGFASLHIPPLRHRREDLPVLAEHFAQQAANELDRPTPRLSPALINSLSQHAWPGNVAELADAMRQAVSHAEGEAMHLWDLPSALQPGDPTLDPRSMTAQVQALETDLIVDALQEARGNVTAAARTLSVTPRIVRYRIKILDIRYDPESNRAWRAVPET